MWKYVKDEIPQVRGSVLVTYDSGEVKTRWYEPGVGWLHTDKISRAEEPMAWMNMPFPAKPPKRSIHDFKPGMSVWSCHREEWGEITENTGKTIFVKWDSEQLSIPEKCNFECLFFEAFEIPNSAKIPPKLIKLKGEENGK